jgi:hypothetical protein
MRVAFSCPAPVAIDSAITVPRHEASITHFMRISYRKFEKILEAPFFSSPQKMADKIKKMAG